jgi:hypothetical protein
METTYNFLSDKEPSDQQLHLLMLEVALEAKKKAEKADKLFWRKLRQLARNARRIHLSAESGNQ